MRSDVKKMRLETRFFFIVVFACLFAFQTAFATDYLVGSQDLLKITVYEHPDLTTEVRVSDEGKITVPLIGELEVKNLSVRQIEKRISEKLSSGSFVSNPQVTVFIEEYKGQTVTVMGEVMKPGQYQITGPTTVIDAVSTALGMTKDAGYAITVIRKESTEGEEVQYKKITIDVDRLFRDGDFKQNLLLQDKDVIYVPRADIFYIYGEVNRPGVYKIERNLTVKKAIAIAGGFTPRASKGKVQITKRQVEKESIKDGSVDEPVETDDVIMIKERLF